MALAGVPYLRFSEPAVDELPERTRAVGPEDVACGSGYCSSALGSQRAGSRCRTERIRDEASKECGLDAVLERRRDGRIDGVLTTERGSDPRREHPSFLPREVGRPVPLALRQLLTLGGIELLALVAQLV